MHQHNWFQNLYRWGWLILQAWWRAGMSETTLGVSTDAFGCRCSSAAWCLYFCSSAAVTEQVSQMTEKVSPVTTVLSHVCSCDMGCFTVDCFILFLCKKTENNNTRLLSLLTALHLQHMTPPKSKTVSTVATLKNDQFSSLHIFNIWDEGGIL